MQLKIQRSQRAAAISGKVIFCLDARVYFTPQEQANITKYRLGNECIYNSESSKKQFEAAAQAHAEGGYMKSLGRLALAALNKNIWVNTLQRGEHIECKDMNELLSAEDAIMQACEKLKFFLETAATFDGREAVFDFSTDTPTVIVPSNPVGIPAPASSAPPPPMVGSGAPADLTQASTVVAAPVAYEPPPPGPAVLYGVPRDTAAFPNTPDFEAAKRWWLTLSPPKRMLFVGGGSIVVGPLLFGWSGFLLALLILAAYVGYEMLVLSR